jgi:hypothetical protein
VKDKSKLTQIVRLNKEILTKYKGSRLENIPKDKTSTVPYLLTKKLQA